MPKAKRIFIISDSKDLTDTLLRDTFRRQIKGFLRLGHDTQSFSYNTAFWQTSPVMSKLLSRRWCKPYVNELLAKQLKNYNPDIVYVGFANFLDVNTVALIREVAPNAFFLGCDNDLWPELHKHRVEIAQQLDLVITTYAGKGLKAYEQAGVRCVFMPFSCDCDIEYRYEVSEKWKSDILFTGKPMFKHKRYPTEDVRHQLLSKLSKMDNCRLYGCYDRPYVGGIKYLYAISGARIGLSVNRANDIRLYHSDRLVQYLACGTLVLAKRVPGSELLFRDGVHLKYFDTVEEFFDLAEWYLENEEERSKIANTGMLYAHREFDCVRMAQYMMDVIEKGTYSAPWNS